jgi:hypothetical protein
MSVYRTCMSRYTQLQRTTSAFTWRSRPHRPGTSSTRGLLGVAPRLRGPISSGGKNVCIIVVRIHQRTLYLDQGHQGLGSGHESTRDTLSLVHRRLSTRSTLPATCYARTEGCRRSLRAQWSYTDPRQRCMGAHSDSPRSPGRGDFNGVFHRLDQGPPPAMPRDFEIGQGHSVQDTQRQACSIGSSTIFPGQGIVHRGDMRPSSLPPPRLTELNNFQRNLLKIEILSNLRFGSLESRINSVTRVTNNF